MPGNIKGIIVEIGGDTTKLQKALSKVNSATSSLTKELRGVNSLLKLDPKNTELLSQKQEILNKTIQETSEKLKTLESVQEQVKEKWQNYINLKPKIEQVAESISKAEIELKELQKAQEKANSEFEKGKISKQQYDKINQEVKKCKNTLKELKQEQKQLNETTVSTESYREFQRELIKAQNQVKQLKLEASNWTKVEKSLNSLNKKASKIGDSFSKVGGTITTSITVPILGLTTAAASIGNNFEKQMSRVQAIAGATKEQLKQLTNQAVELGASTSFGASEAAEGMENLASAGFNTTEIMKAMPGLLDLAASSGADLATASEIAASAIRGFGLDADKAGHVADVFAEAAAKTNAQTEDMGEAMKYIAPVAHTMGISLEETAAAIGIMSDAGIKGSQAGTSLRGALTRLTKPTDKMTKVMERLGISFYDSKGKMKSLTEIIKMLQDSTAELSEEEQQYALTTLFGTESLSGMLSLIQRGPNELNGLTKSFETCDGAASNMADTMLDNTSGSIEEMSGALESLAIKIQQMLAPYITKAANKITELINKFMEIPESTQKTILAIAAITAVVGPILIIIGKLITAFSVISGAFSTVAGAIGKLSAGTGALSKALTVLTGPVGIVIGVIAGLIGAFVHLYNSNEQFRAKAQETWNNIVSLFQNTVMPVIDNIKNLVMDAINTITSVLQQLWGFIEPFITEMLTWLMDFWNNTGSKIVENVMGVVNGLIDLVSMIWNNIISPIISFLMDKLQPVFSVVFGAISGVVQAFGDTIGSVVKAVTGVFKGIIDFITGVFSGNWEKAWNGIKDIFSNIVSGLGAIIKAPINGIISIINGMIRGLNRVKVPDWVPGIGGKGINIPEIPQLAKGGIVDKATLAMIGEGKSAEAVIPLDRTLTKYMAKALKEANGTQSNNVVVNFYPQQMTEQEMERAFNYVDRRYGFQW